jgi:hypothetical protein
MYFHCRSPFVSDIPSALSICDQTTCFRRHLTGDEATVRNVLSAVTSEIMMPDIVSDVRSEMSMLTGRYSTVVSSDLLCEKASIACSS